jgi:hypothetical protein
MFCGQYSEGIKSCSVKGREDELNNVTFCIETCRAFYLNETQMEINNIQDCSLSLWGECLQKHQALF